MILEDGDEYEDEKLQLQSHNQVKVGILIRGHQTMGE